MRSQYWTFDRLGGPDVLRLAEESVGEPGSGQVLLRQYAVGLNFTDINLRRGDHPEPPVFPCRIGQEAAGIVEAVGPDVTDVQPGDRVCYATRPPAAYCERRLVAADRILPVPDDIGLDVAAAGLLKGMTAEYLLHRTYPVGPEDTVVFYAAAGGVGSLACRWATRKGARVVGIVGSPEKVEAAKAAGCHSILIWGQDDIVAGVREASDGRMATVVYDSLGAVSYRTSLACLRRRGLLVCFGAASGAIPPMEPSLLAAHGSLFQTWARIGDYTVTRKDLLASSDAVFKAHAEGIFDLTPTARFGFHEAPEAQRMLEQRKIVGASVLIVENAGGAALDSAN